MPFASQVRRVAVGVVPDDEREVGYFTFRPDAGRVDGRGPAGARRAPDGRSPAQPLAAARLRAHPARGARGRAAPARRRRAATPRTSGSSPSPRCASSSSCATRPARSPRCRTSSARWPTASRRSAGRAPRSAPAPGSTPTTSGCTSGPPVEADLDQLTALQGKVAPMTAGAGIEEVRIEGGDRRGATATPCRSARGSPTSRGPGSPSPSTAADRPGSRRSTATPRRCVRARRRGLVYPYELVSMVAGAGWLGAEHDLDDVGPARAGRPPVRREHRRPDLRSRHDPDAAAPRGREPGAALRRPAALPGCRGRARVRPGDRGPRPRRGAGPARRVVRALGRRPDLDGLRHREHGLGRQGAQADHRVHPGRARDQRRRRRHQRRRAALLERRGDDAHAHQGHPRHDPRLARWCSPASSRSTSPAASRPRTTSASAATTASWGPTARRSTGPRTSSTPTASCSRTTRTPGSRRASPARDGRRPATRTTATSRPTPTRSRAATSPRSATSSRRRRTPTARRRSTSAP